MDRVIGALMQTDHVNHAQYGHAFAKDGENGA